jgi:hypothetical protein
MLTCLFDTQLDAQLDAESGLHRSCMQANVQPLYRTPHCPCCVSLGPPLLHAQLVGCKYPRPPPPHTDHFTKALNQAHPENGIRLTALLLTADRLAIPLIVLPMSTHIHARAACMHVGWVHASMHLANKLSHSCVNNNTLFVILRMQ